MRPSFNLQVYLVTDRPLALGRPIEWIVEEAVKGGATMVQLREKDCSSREFLDVALSLKKILAPYHVPLIINDRLDIALACDAEGVHIGQSDLPYDVARRLLGDNKIIGLSVENEEQILAANDLDVDYLGVSPIFATPTKTDTFKPFGLEGLRKAAQLSRHRLVGIGRMNAQNAAQVIDAGAEGVAVVSAIVSAANPMLATENIKNQIVGREKWSKRAWNYALPIYKKTLAHPFLQELMAGTLNKKRFEHYIQQDALYLADYGHHLSLIADRFTNPAYKELFKRFASDSVACEKALHEVFFKQLNMPHVSQKSPACAAYTSFLYDCVSNKSIEEALAAVLPCFWVYNEVGKYIFAHQSNPDNPYKAWIETYAGDAFDADVRSYIDICDEYAEKSPQLQPLMTETFAAAVQAEHDFWDGAYKSMI